MTWLQNYDALHKVAFPLRRADGAVGILVSLQAYVFPFTEIVVK